MMIASTYLIIEELTWCSPVYPRHLIINGQYCTVLIVYVRIWETRLLQASWRHKSLMRLKPKSQNSFINLSLTTMTKHVTYLVHQTSHPFPEKVPC